MINTDGYWNKSPSKWHRDVSWCAYYDLLLHISFYQFFSIEFAMIDHHLSWKIMISQIVHQKGFTNLSSFFRPLFGGHDPDYKTTSWSIMMVYPEKSRKTVSVTIRIYHDFSRCVKMCKIQLREVQCRRDLKLSNLRRVFWHDIKCRVHFTYHLQVVQFYQYRPHCAC